MARWDSFDRFFEPSRPRAAKGGIRAQTKKGAFGESWWAKRWIAVLEGFLVGGRLQRGRSYARRGQVLSIEVGKGVIFAQVQGSRPSPYRVEIRVKPLAKSDWRKVATAVSEQAVYASKLLGGEMPLEMEDAFRSVGVSLFPERYRDLRTDCTCPDSSNPCKHIAAVYYLLGEEFDRDPFLIFRMRGMDRQEFLELLGESVPTTPMVPALPPEPLPSDPGRFWSGASLPENLAGSAPASPPGAALARRLGKFPFWRGTLPLAEFLEKTYNAASLRATTTLEGK